MERLENSRLPHRDVSETGRTEKTHSDRANTHGVQGTMGWCRLQPWTVVGQWPLLRLQRPFWWMGRVSSQISTTGSCSHIREWTVLLCLLLPCLPFLGCSSWSFPKYVSEQLTNLEAVWDGADGNSPPLLRTSGLPFSQWWAETERESSLYSAY